MALFKYSKLPFFTKRSHRQLVIFVLITIISNFFLFPVHAADENLENSYSDSKLEIIKAPDSPKKLFEEFVAKTNGSSLLNLKPEESDFVKNFVISPEDTTEPLISVYKKQKAEQNSLIESNPEIPVNSRFATLTAYNSEAAQCDGDPCTTASGFNVCKHGIEDTVAANFLPLGTKIKIPELFGDRVFTVRDRTARKYGDRVDVWMIEKQDALQFGKKNAHIVVLD